MKNKRLKRTLLFLLTICTLLCAVMFVACGGNNNQTYHLYQDETYEQDNYIGFYDNDTWKASWNMVGGSYTKSDNTVIFFDAEGNFVISGVMYENVLKLEDGREYRVKGETDEQGRPFTSEADVLSLGTGVIDRVNYKIVVDLPNNSTSYDIKSNIVVPETAAWKLYNEKGERIISRTIENLNEGDNRYIIVVKSGDWTNSVSYSLNVHVVYPVEISYYSDNVLYSSEVVNTHTILGDGPSIANKTGYTFKTWGSKGWYVEKATRFDAVWVGNTYYVEYDGNYESYGSMTKSTHVYGTASKLSKNEFVKQGKIFAGWSLLRDAQPSYVDEASVTNLCADKEGVIKLYAFWSSVVYNVRYNANNANAVGEMTNSQHYYDIEKALNENLFSVEGYHFVGWSLTPQGNVIYDDGELVSNLSSENNATVDLYAQWEVNTYTVEYSGNGATNGEVASQTFVYGESHIVQFGTALSRNGYKYAGGWSDSENGALLYADGTAIGDLTTENNVTITLYAVWVPNTYTVRYNANGGQGQMSNSTHTYGVGKMLNENYFVRTGMHFAGWSLEEGSTVCAYNNCEVVQNLTDVDLGIVDLYAIWASNIYYIDFNKNDANATGSMDRQIFYYGVERALNPSLFVKEGYHVAGWAYTATGTKVFEPEQKLSTLTEENGKVITLYAIWEVNTYSIMYDANGATSGVTETSIHTYNKQQELTLNGYVKTGYTFIGWSTERNGEVVYQNGQKVINLTNEHAINITVYACWTPNTYTVSYDGNGADRGVVENTLHIYDVSSALASNSFERDGYRFIGWGDDEDNVYYTGQNVSNLTTENNVVVILKAVWHKNVTTISVANANQVVVPNEDFQIKVGYGLEEVAINNPTYVLISSTFNNSEVTLTSEGVLNVTAVNGGTVTVKVSVSEPYGVFVSDEYVLTVGKGVSSANALEIISQDMNGSYALTEDITINASDWVPLGTESNPFNGKLVSGDHKIIIVIEKGAQVPPIIEYASDNAVIDIVVQIKTQY